MSCPFCGGGEIEYQDYLNSGWMECAGCEARGPTTDLAMADPSAARVAAQELWDGRSGDG